MKPLPLFLGLSLIANAAFFLVGHLAQTDSGPTLHSTALRDTPSPPATLPSAVRVASIWENLRAGDPAAQTQLRAAGWPEDTLRAIVVVLVDDFYRDQETALRLDPWSGTEYWKERSFGQHNAKSLHALSREKQTLLKTILGPNYRPESYAADLRYVGLSPKKTAAVAAIIAIDAQIKAALGDQRYANYQRSQDDDYRTLHSLVARLARTQRAKP